MLMIISVIFPLDADPRGLLDPGVADCENTTRSDRYSATLGRVPGGQLSVVALGVINTPSPLVASLAVNDQ